MHLKQTRALLLVAAVLLAPGRVAAQAPTTRNLATDTLQPDNPAYHRPVSQIQTTGGQRLYVFLEQFGLYPDRVDFTWRHPLILPRPKLVRIAPEQIQWLRTGGQVYEPVRVGATGAGPLAVRVSNGPRLALFDVATPKKGVPIPVPGAVIWTGAFSNNFNHAWYVRAPGEARMRAVPKGRAFAAFAAALLGDAPELAAAIQSNAEGHGHDDMPQLVKRYNATRTAPPALH